MLCSYFVCYVSTNFVCNVPTNFVCYFPTKFFLLFLAIILSPMFQLILSAMSLLDFSICLFPIMLLLVLSHYSEVTYTFDFFDEIESLMIQQVLLLLL